MSESVPYDEEKFIPKIFDLIAKIPFSDCQAPEIYCTCTEMIAAYSDWLFTHTSYLSTAYEIMFLGVAVPNPYVRLIATVSLKDVTSECQNVLHPYAQNIVKSCSDAILIHGQILDSSEKARLMHTFGCAVVMACPEVINDCLAALTSPLMNELAAVAQQTGDLDATHRAVILDRLNMLNSLFESLHVREYCGNDYEDADENNMILFEATRLHSAQGEADKTKIVQPAVSLLQQLIPILKILVENYKSDEEVMMKISESVTKSAKNLSIEIKPVLEDLMEILINAYDPLLNFSTIQETVLLFNIFRVDPTVRGFLRDAFATITDKTLSYCLNNPLRQLSVTVEVYFKFAYLICKRFFYFFTEQPCHFDVDLLYKLALASLELPEKRTLTEVCNFLTMFRMKSLGEPQLHAIFVSHLDLLLASIFNIFAGNYATPRNAIDTVTDMLFFIFDAQEAVPILDQIVKRENFPSPLATNDGKARLVSTLLQEAKRKNRRKFKDACTEFVFKVRNINRVM